MEEVNGISLKKYAELIASTTDTVTEAEFWEVLAKEGITLESWQPIKDGWNAELMKPENYLTVAQEYNGYLEEAIEKKNNGNPPCTMETFADLTAQMYYRKDPDNPENLMDFSKM